MAVFVGRTRELQRLNRLLEQAQSGKGRVVFLTGEAGAGKSTLVSQFMVDAALRSSETRIIGAACSEQYGAGEPYQPFIEAFRDLVDTQERTGSRWSEFRDIAAELAPAWIAAVPLAGGFIAATMSTAVELKKLGGGVATAAPSEEALFFQYTELFFAAAAQAPIVLFIDDLHWADRASIALLTHLARKIGDQRVLILGTYRSADVDVTSHPIREAKLELERYGLAEVMALEALDSSALTEFLESELGGRAAPELQAWLEQIAGSNPLFFGELLRWAVEHGVAAEHAGEWVLAREPDSVEVPRSAESTIERRLTRLDPDLYKLLEYAAVEGNEFGSTTTSQLLGMDELEFEEAMEPLVRLHRLIKLVDTRELPSGDLSSIYQFGHSLIKDVLHRNLQGKRRILLHRKMAEILERLYAGHTEAVAHKLAIHFDEGRIGGRAYEFALIGAERASHLYAHRDAIGLIRLALRNAQDDDQKLNAYERLGDAYQVVGQYGPALEAFGQALDVAKAHAKRELTVSLSRKMLTIEREHGGLRMSELEERLGELLVQAEELAASAELCQILLEINELSTAFTREKLQRGERALCVAEGLGIPNLIATMRISLATTELYGPNPKLAEPHLREALRLYNELGDRDRIAVVHNQLGIMHVMRGVYDAATHDLEVAATEFNDIGHPVAEAMARNNLGLVLTRVGDFEGAERNLTESLRLCRRLDVAARVMHPLENLARLHQARDELERARACWQEVLDFAQRTGYWSAEVTAHCGLGEIDLNEDKLAIAQEHATAAQALLADKEAWHDGRTDYHLFAARLAAEAGDHQYMRELLWAAEQAHDNGERYLLATVRLRHAELLAQSDPAAAAPLMESAIQILDELGSKAAAERAHAKLSAIRGAA